MKKEMSAAEKQILEDSIDKIMAAIIASGQDSSVLLHTLYRANAKLEAKLKSVESPAISDQAA